MKRLTLTLGLLALLFGATTAHAATCAIGGINFTCYQNSDGNFSLAASPAQPVATGTAWTSATSGGTTQSLSSALGVPALQVTLAQTTTITGGAVTFKCSYDGSTFVNLPTGQLYTVFGNPTANPYTLVASTSQQFVVLMGGCQSIQLALSTAITGSGSVTPTTVALPVIPSAVVANRAAGCNGITSFTANALINTTANTQVINGVAGQKIYVCAINAVASAADNVAVVEGSGSTCATSTLGVMGGATAATGWNLAANNGIAIGSGRGVVAQTITAGDALCIYVSSGAQVSGNIIYVQY